MSRIALFSTLWLVVAAATPGGGSSPSDTAIPHADAAKDRPAPPPDLVPGPGVVWDEGQKAFRLAKSVLLADETGATDFKQTETLGDAVSARKTFVLDSTEVTAAELIFFGAAEKISVNGQALPAAEPIVSTGWKRVAVPVKHLRKGENDFVFSAGGQLLYEPNNKTGRSRKSLDGGKTWATGCLGKHGVDCGEYLVRLRLGGHVRRGEIHTRVESVGRGLAPADWPALRLKGVWRSWKARMPEGTDITCYVRTGSTYVPDPATWTEWAPQKFEEHVLGDKQDGHQFVQHRWVLTTTRPDVSPLFFGAELFVKLDETGLVPADRSDVRETGRRPASSPQLPPRTFVYQAPSPRLALLREKYALDKVIAPGKTEMEQLMLLRHWVRHQWHTAWKGGPESWMPPWDALIVLSSNDQADCLTMCTHYAAVYTQCCLALGWNARHVILDHHCVAEVFVNEHNKWVMMDAGNSAERADVNLHFARGGKPLSALELHQAYRDRKTAGIEIVFTPAELAKKIEALCRPAPPPQAPLPARPDTDKVENLKNYPVCGIENYRRYAIVPRNNYLDTLLPGEHYQGWSEYFYDGYWWVGDTPDDPRLSPEYSHHLSPAQPDAIDWPLNWTRIDLARTAKAGEIRVDLSTFTPNFDRFERDVGSAAQPKWEKIDAGFLWKLAQGKNLLRVRSVNQFNRPGVEASVEVEWQPEHR